MKSNKSIIVSIWVVRLLILFLFFSAFFIPMLGKLYSQLAGNGTDISVQISVSLYCLLLPALGTLSALHMLLINIRKGNMFVPQNIKYLTIICIGVFLVGIICSVVSFVSWVFAFIAVAFLFVGLILLVLRNVFNNAVNIKEENDFTI